MRVAMVNWTARRVGGAEQYLHRVIPALAGAGHEVVLARESDGPRDRDAIAGQAIDATPTAVRAFRPDVLVVHGLLDPDREAALLGVAPAVLIAHSYYGTCISGQKTFTWPTVTPCVRRLGWGCVLRYYPRRTGGLDPRTLARAWSLQRARQALHARYRAVGVFSDHMRREYQRHGRDDVRVLPFPVDAPAVAVGRPAPMQNRLLFVGRCDPLKGGGTLISALAHLPATVTLTVVGDGPARTDWERAAARAAPDRVHFTGWVADVGAAYRAADLLVLPSLWPEPFGQVGLEAARHAVPTVAFPAGGIPEWLRDGESGLLAARHGHAGALASAIRAALVPSTYATLSAGALRRVGAHQMTAHLGAFVKLLEGVA